MVKRNFHCLVTGIVGMVLCLMPVSKAFTDELQQPQQLIQTISETLKQRLKDKNFTRDFAQVTRFVNSVIEPHTDFSKIAPLVLGKYWKSATPSEQDRFKHEFQTLLVRAYSRAFVEYNDWNIKYLPLDMLNNPVKVVVKTEVVQQSTPPVDVNYRMYLDNGEWKVYDIMIEGVSLVSNYRTSFSEEIQRSGSLASVIDNLAKRNTSALAPPEQH